MNQNQTITQLLLILLFSLFTLTSPLHALTIDSLTFSKVLHFASGFSDNFKRLGGHTKIINLKNNDDHLIIHQVAFRPLGETFSSSSRQASGPIGILGEVNNGDITHKPLCYPSPFRQEEGTTLGYGLSQSMDIEIQVYDMLANLVTKKTFVSGSLGGKEGYNKVRIDLTTFDGYQMPVGAYFFLLVNNGRVLDKGKVAVLP